MVPNPSDQLQDTGIEYVDATMRNNVSANPNSELESKSPFSQQTSKRLVKKAVDAFELMRIKVRDSPQVTNLHMLFNIADVGGQPAFLDMLPSLTIGPALYLLFSKLVNDNDQVLSIDDFSMQQSVKYRTKSDKEPKDCQGYTYTLSEVLLSALSSIACFGVSDNEVEKFVSEKTNSHTTSSLAIMFGTFADKINEEGNARLVETEAALKSLLESTDFCKKNLIAFPNPRHSDHRQGQVFFRINNKSGSKQEMFLYRHILQELIEERFRKFNIPASWLGLGTVIKILASTNETYKVSLNDCVQIGEHFKMSQSMVKAALKFLHKYIGLVMYFPDNRHLQPSSGVF